MFLGHFCFRKQLRNNICDKKKKAAKLKSTKVADIYKKRIIHQNIGSEARNLNTSHPLV